MGFFDKMKQAANFVTGGGATVTLEGIASSYQRGEPLTFTINVTVKDAPLNVRGVYLEIQGVEHITMRGRSVRLENGETIKPTINEQERTHFSKHMAMETETELEAGSSHSFEVSFELPPEVQPTYNGKFGRHEWTVQAGIDVRGNDPDSNWQPIRLV